MRYALVVGALIGSLSCLPGLAHAHGIWGHIHVTAWALSEVEGDELRTFFDDPIVLNAALFGSAFTDSGYWPASGRAGDAARAYSEHTHWEPFVQDFVDWIIANDPPPWVTIESKQRVAFLMGCAAHGLQDELFDSLFLHYGEHHDGGEQEALDPGTDGFLAMDGYIEFVPEPWMPIPTLIELYEARGITVDEALLEAMVSTMMSAYVNTSFGLDLAVSFGEGLQGTLSWTRDHYMDPTVPGSLKAEVRPTAAYLQALWDRLHLRTSEHAVVLASYPVDGERLRGNLFNTPDAWVTLVYPRGVDQDSVDASWYLNEREEQAFRLEGTQWGQSWTRLHRLKPEADLPNDVMTTISLAPGIRFIDGTETDHDANIEVLTACSMPPCEPSRGDPDESAAPVERPEPTTPTPPSTTDVSTTGGTSGGCQLGGAASHSGRSLVFLIGLIALLGRCISPTRRAGE